MWARRLLVNRFNTSIDSEMKLMRVKDRVNAKKKQ